MPPLKSLSVSRNTMSVSSSVGEGSSSIPNHEPSSDRVQELHKQLCKLQLRYDRLERERNDQADRLQELEQLLNGYEGDDPQEVLLTQSLQLAEALNTIETLKSKVHLLTQENETLKKKQEIEKEDEEEDPPRLLPQRKSSFQLLRRRGQSFRGVLPSKTGENNENSNAASYRPKNLVVVPNPRPADPQLTADRQLADLHRKIMEKQIEALEEERNHYFKKCQHQAATIAKLQEEQKLQAIKIEMLEQVVQSVNNGPSSSSSSSKGEDRVNTSPSSSSNQQESVPLLRRIQSTIPSRSHASSTAPPPTTNNPLQSNVNKLSRSSCGSNGNRKRIQVIINGEAAWYTGTVDETSDGSTTIPHGTGSIKFSNGDKYFGQVQHGEMHGHGTFYSSTSNDMKRGRFEHDVYVGR